MHMWYLRLLEEAQDERLAGEHSCIRTLQSSSLCLDGCLDGCEQLLCGRVVRVNGEEVMEALARLMPLSQLAQRSGFAEQRLDMLRVPRDGL